MSVQRFVSICGRFKYGGIRDIWDKDTADPSKLNLDRDPAFRITGTTITGISHSDDPRWWFGARKRCKTRSKPSPREAPPTQGGKDYVLYRTEKEGHQVKKASQLRPHRAIEPIVLWCFDVWCDVWRVIHTGTRKEKRSRKDWLTFWKTWSFWSDGPNSRRLRQSSLYFEDQNQKAILMKA